MKIKNSETIKLKVDFYADTFRSGFLDVPKELEDCSEALCRQYVLNVLHSAKGKLWEPGDVVIITCKKVTNEL